MFNYDPLLSAREGLSHLRRRSGELLTQGSCGQLALPIDLGALKRRASDVCIGAAGTLLSGGGGSQQQLDHAKSPSVDLHFSAMAVPQRRTSAVSLGLGSFNPDLYNDPNEGDLDVYPEGHTGRLWFTVEYDGGRSALRLTIDKCRNLPIDCGADCLVRASLAGSEHDYKETSTRRDRDADFNEPLDFELSPAASTSASLILTAVEHTGRRLRHPMGAVHFPLADYSRCRRSRLTVWRDLRRPAERQLCGRLGQLHVALAFDAGADGTLRATLIEARQLATRSGKPADTYCKLTLTIGSKSASSKKSSTGKKCLNPIYNSSVDFKLPPHKRDSACILISVMQTTGAAAIDKCIGRAVVGGIDALCAGDSVQHWSEAKAAGGTAVEMWHYLHE